MENIIVTGGFGFIGLNLMSFLTNKKKYVIHNIDNYSLGHSYYDTFLSKDQKNLINNYKVDINNNEIIKNILETKNIKKVFHLAAESHVDRSISGPINFFKSNVMGTLNLVENCRNYIEKNNIKNFKFLHVSTDEVFGDLTLDEAAFNEKTPYNPSSPYSASKAASDFILKSWFRTYKFPGIISNCSNNFGPCQNIEKFMPLSIMKLLNNEKMGIYGSGENIRDWIYVEDHVETLDVIMENGKFGESYCIGGDNELSNIRLFQKLYDLMKFEMNLNVLPFENSFEYIEDRKGHDFRYSLSSDKIKKEFGLKFNKDIDTNIKKTIQFYLSQNS